MVYLHSHGSFLVDKTHIDNFAQIGVYSFNLNLTIKPIFK